MATLWIREYSKVGSAPGNLNPGGSPQSLAQEPGTDQTVTFSTSVASVAFGSDTKYIGIISDVAFHYVVGSSPVATTGALKIPADTLVFVGVTVGNKIAAIAAA